MNLQVVALCESLEMKARSPEKSIDVTDATVLEGALSRGTSLFSR